MKDKTLLLLGAKSDIGIAIAHKFAKEGYNIQLAGRNSEELKEDCSDIKIRYNVDATFHELEALDIKTHRNFVSSLPKLPDIVISAIGILGSQKEDEKDVNKSIMIIRTNFEGIISIFSHIATGTNSFL